MKEWVIHIGFVSVRRGGKSGSRDTCVKNAKDLVHLRKSKKVQALEVKSTTSTLSLHAFSPHLSLPCFLFPSRYISYVTLSRWLLPCLTCTERLKSALQRWHGSVRWRKIKKWFIVSLKCAKTEVTSLFWKWKEEGVQIFELNCLERRSEVVKVFVLRHNNNVWKFSLTDEEHKTQANWTSRGFFFFS